MAWQAGCGRPANSLFVRDALNLDELVPLLAKFEGLVNNFVKKVTQKAVQNHFVSQRHFAKWPVSELFFQKCFPLLFQIPTVQ